jgi:hypothetical protein
MAPDIAHIWIKGQLFFARLYRADPRHRNLLSLGAKTLFECLFCTSLHDPSAPYILFVRNRIIPFLPSLACMNEGFWWGFTVLSTQNHMNIRGIPIHKRTRFSGDARIYFISNLPGVIARNTAGLIR